MTKKGLGHRARHYPNLNLWRRTNVMFFDTLNFLHHFTCCRSRFDDACCTQGNHSVGFLMKRATAIIALMKFLHGCDDRSAGIFNDDDANAYSATHGSMSACNEVLISPSPQRLVPRRTLCSNCLGQYCNIAATACHPRRPLVINLDTLYRLWSYSILFTHGILPPT